MAKEIGFECIHASYFKDRRTWQDDVVLVKEHVHYDDGTIVPKLREIRNHQRELHVHQPGYRDYKDKREWVPLKECNTFTSTQIGLDAKVAQALEWFGPPPQLRVLARSPYLYGTDITTSALIHDKYLTKFPDLNSEATVAVLDYETDVVHGTEEILAGSLTFGSKAIIAVTEDFVKGITGVESKVHTAFGKYLQKYRKARGIELEVVVCGTEVEVVLRLLERAHEWSPDYITGWGINFDIKKMLLAMKRARVDPADYFSDPNLPRAYRYFKYREGKMIKVTATGKKSSKHVADLWHWIYAPASFQWIDSMCLYKQLRVTEGNQPSYSLDAILNRHLNLGKLRFAEADAYTGLSWHQVMQTKFKIEYLVYCIFDCIGVELLNEDTGDIGLMRTLLGHTDTENFSSTPKRLADDMHLYCRDRGLVVGTTSDKMVEEYDKLTAPLKGWIAILPSHHLKQQGLPLLEEFPELETSMNTFVSDLDVEGSYPWTQSVLNISKETTLTEVGSVKGRGPMVQKHAGLNLTAARTNAVEVCCEVLQYPSLEAMLYEFKKTKGIE